MTNRGPQCYKTSSYLLRVLASRFRSMSRKAATVGRMIVGSARLQEQPIPGTKAPQLWMVQTRHGFRLIPAAQLRNLGLAAGREQCPRPLFAIPRFGLIFAPAKSAYEASTSDRSVTNPSGLQRARSLLSRSRPRRFRDPAFLPAAALLYFLTFAIVSAPVRLRKKKKAPV